MTCMETASYLSIFSKPGPNCHVLIEKSTGCDHMTCGQCQHEFCWECLHPIQDGHHNCITTQESINTQTHDLRRLVDCNDKIEAMNHLNDNVGSMLLLQLKEKQRHVEKLEEKLRIDFVKEAVQVLLRCRRTLTDSLITEFFYLNESDLQWIQFELYQKELQASSDELSRLLEGQVIGEHFLAMRSALSRIMKSCKENHETLLSYAKEGF